MGAIRDRIGEDIKDAMRKRSTERLETLRLLKAEILKRETAAGAKELDEAGWVQLLGTMKKQREESALQFDKGGRPELAEKERREIVVLETYLPRQLSDAELGELITAAMAEAGAKDIKAMGAVMKIVQARAAGGADGKRISAMVRTRLGG